MIIGIGIDIIDTRRIKEVINKYGDRFKNKCFSAVEIIKSEEEFDSVNSYAKKYAAKEACSKALGTGIAKGINWQDIEVNNNSYGKPTIILRNKALRRVKEISKNNFNIDISLSDEKNYAIANVIISKK